MTFDLADVVLLVLLAVAITVAIASPRARAWAIRAGLLVLGLFGGKKLTGLGADAPAEPASPTGGDLDDTPIPDPAASLQTELDDAHDAIDALPPDDLAAAWAEHGERADHE